MYSPKQLHRQLSTQSPRLRDLEGKRHAAVAMILRFVTNLPEVLLIERAHNEQDIWSGHLAMPGGKIEPIDKSPLEAAKRETLEEIGVQLDSAHFMGQLSDVGADGIPMVVSCFVFYANGPIEFNLDPIEVADAFWFPLRHMDDPVRAMTIDKKVPDGRKSFPAIRVAGKSQPLWGITYKLINELRNHLSVEPMA